MVPRFRSVYAVEVALLIKITNDLVHNAGSFSSALTLWSKQHAGPLQQSLSLGENLNLARHTREDLQVSWYAWQSMRRGGCGQSIHWEFTVDGFEKCLLAVAPLHAR